LGVPDLLGSRLSHLRRAFVVTAPRENDRFGDSASVR